MTIRKLVNFKTLSVALVVALALGCSSSDEDGTDATTPNPDGGGEAIVTPPGGDIIIGGIFHDDISESAANRLAAVEMAIEEINASKAFPDNKLVVQNERPTLGDAADGDKAAKGAKKLGDAGAVGIVAIFSSLGGAIRDATQAAPYDKLVQCNASATSPTINDDDKTDTFYRTVVDDLFQSKYLARMIKDKGWGKVGNYSLDDAYGKGMTEGLKDAGVTFEWEGTHPEGDFAIEAEKATMDAAIAAGLDVIILTTLKAASPGIVKYLTESGFKGTILMTDGGKSDDVFAQAKELKTWLGDSGNDLIGTEPDNYAGDNSKAFQDNYKAKTGEEANTYSSPAYDCTYAIAYALVYAGTDAVSAAGVHSNMGKFKAAGDTDVGIGADEFKKGADAIAGGGTVNYNGASGPMLFDADGNRDDQPFRTYKANAAVDAWEVGEQLPPLAE